MEPSEPHSSNVQRPSKYAFPFSYSGDSMLPKRKYSQCLVPEASHPLNYSNWGLRVPYADGENSLKKIKEDKFFHGVYRTCVHDQSGHFPVLSSNLTREERIQSDGHGGEREGVSVTYRNVLGFQGCPSRDRLASTSETHKLCTDTSFSSLGKAIDGPLSSYLADPMKNYTKCAVKSQRELREDGDMGDTPHLYPIDRCEIMHACSSKNVSSDVHEEPIVSTRTPSFGLRMKEPCTSLQSVPQSCVPGVFLNESMDGVLNRKHIDNMADRRTKSFNDSGSDYYSRFLEGSWREKRRFDNTYQKNSAAETQTYCQMRPNHDDALPGVAASELLTDDGLDYMHGGLSETRVSGIRADHCTNIRQMDGKDDRWIERRGLDDTYNRYTEVEPSRCWKGITFHDGNLHKVPTLERHNDDGYDYLHGCPSETHLSWIRTNRCKKFQEMQMNDDQWRERKRPDNFYNKYAGAEPPRYCEMRPLNDDRLHRVASSRLLSDGRPDYMLGCMSETVSRVRDDRCSRFEELEANDGQWREQRSVYSTFNNYPEVEPSRNYRRGPFHVNSLHRVAGSGLLTNDGSDYMRGRPSETCVSWTRTTSPSKWNRHNMKYHDDADQENEEEQGHHGPSIFHKYNDYNVYPDQHGFGIEQSAKDDAVLNHSKPICQPDLDENSEEFKRHVHSAFLRFSKLLNENPGKKKKYQEQGKAGSLTCSVCGRLSIEFVDTHSLVMHTYNSEQADLRAEHKGLHKALCVLMGWRQDIPPDDARSYQSLSLLEARANEEDLILWPPLIVVQNARVGKRKDGHWEGIGNPEMDELLRELGFGSGKSKALYGRDGHQGIILVKFLSTFAGFQEAERLHKYFEGHHRGRKKWLHVQSSSHTSQEIDDEDPDLVRIDKETKEKKRVLYGYIAIAGDLEKVDFDTRKRTLVKTRKDIETIAGSMGRSL
eukprot:Gb_05458 [translate_table: standard]